MKGFAFFFELFGVNTFSFKKKKNKKKWKVDDDNDEQQYGG